MDLVTDMANGSSANLTSCGAAPELPLVGSNTTPSAGPADHFDIVNMVIPGFSVFSGMVQAYLGIDLNLYIPFIAVACGAIFGWRYINDSFWTLIEKYLMSSVKIRTDDEIYTMIMAWVARQGFSRRSRRFIVNTELNRGTWYWYRYYDDDDDQDDEETADDEDAMAGMNGGNPDSKKKRLRYTPSFGSHIFWYRGTLLLFDRDENRDQTTLWGSSSDKESLSISCFGRNPRILKQLLMEARLEYMQRDECKTLIYRASGGHANSDPSWQRCMARANRPFSTVILNEKVKKELVDDINDYLDPATRKWYSNRGIPFRRGYCLEGPPGTGKSSLSLALAGYFRMRIYIVNLNSLAATEENLSELFSELPRRCMVLLEDIDSAGLTHTRDAPEPNTVPQTPVGTAAPALPGPHGGPLSPPPGRLSLSGLLNVLDGVASQEGRILIMTTNHIEKLDKALIRPGRVDMIVKFSLADKDLTSSIFRAIYAPYEGEAELSLGASKVKQNGTSNDEKRALTALDEPDEQRMNFAQRTTEVNALAKEFAAKIPENEFSPAEIQGLLLRNKRDPRAAIAQVDEWIVQTRIDRREKETKDEQKRAKAERKWRKKEAKKKAKKAKRKAKKLAKKKKNAKEGEEVSDVSSSDSDSDGSSSSSSESEPEEETKPPAKSAKSTRARDGKKKGSKPDASGSEGSDAEDEAEPKSKDKKVKADKAKNESKPVSDAKTDEKAEADKPATTEATSETAEEDGVDKKDVEKAEVKPLATASEPTSAPAPAAPEANAESPTMTDDDARSEGKKSTTSSCDSGYNT